ncbi:MAG TPA: 4a-hydroxytetrahydrobiopterin dehydratase [Ignavibacteria bacterium]|jgi:4a-hydroxytetrahydrobiopterin dehydratase|nr:4a-hydroxytetrahydrobiopterin dehydratase [Ignavibacteria bacterium]
MEKLNPDLLLQRIKEANGWFVDGNSIKKVFKTKGFPQTAGLVTVISAICQQFDHHPDYILMKYSELEVSFSTHSAGGITDKDIEIALEINKFV